MKELAQFAAILFILLVGVVAFYAKRADHETAKSRKYASISSMAAYMICGLSIASLLYVGFGIPGFKITHKKGEIRGEIIQPAPSVSDITATQSFVSPDSTTQIPHQPNPVPTLPDIPDSLVTASANEAFTVFVKIVDFGDRMFEGIISSLTDSDSVEASTP